MERRDRIMNKTQEIEGIIFDLGGVVIDEFEFGFYDDAANKFGVSPSEVEKVADEEWAPLERGEETNIQFWQKVARRLGLDRVAGERLASMWLEHYRQNANIKKGVLGLIKKLHGKYASGVISNSQREHSIINRKRGLFKSFDVVLLSDEVGMRKPQKEIFELASEKMKIPFQNLLFIDNDMRWVDVAEKYGLKAILFESTEQLKKEFEKLGIRVGQ